jgi:hypothetical protein
MKNGTRGLTVIRKLESFLNVFNNPFQGQLALKESCLYPRRKKFQF